jgi:hypothetical protein
MKRFSIKRLFSVLAVFFIANGYALPAHANTLRVPSEFATIQSAVDAAVDGDTILVASGTYFENIYINATAIHLRSEVGPEDTIIDGGNLAQVIRVEAVSSLIIEGFTIQRGNPGVSSWPAGVQIGSGRDITIRNNILRDNSCESSCVGVGIGIFGNRSGPVLIEDNIIENNYGLRCGGGAIGVASAVNLQIINNVIRNNQCNVGGGIYIRSALGSTIIKNNEIKNNGANINGGGVWTLGVLLSMTQNLITGNTAQRGGGVYTDVERLVGNSTSFTNNTVANNFSANGADIYLRGDVGSPSTITLVNNSISNGEGYISLFCDIVYPPVLQLHSNNVYSSTDPAYGGSCSDIFTGIDGNISEPPMYIDAPNGDFRPNADSPLIDAGNNTASDVPAEDLSGLPRIVDGDGDGLAIVDMGAYEVQEAITIVKIDIKPDSHTNSINLKSSGVVAAAILTSEEFDALMIDPDTVGFGPSGAARAHIEPHVEDVDYDGDMDLLFHFRTQETGIQCGDIEASLIGVTWGGADIKGTDSIRPIKCK